MRLGPLSSLVAGTAAAQALALAALPLLTRAFPVEAFGTFGTVVAFYSICAVAACLRLETAIVGAADDREAARLVGACLRIAPLASVALTAALWAASHAVWLPDPTGAGWLAIAALAWLAGVQSTLRSRAVRGRDYGGVAGATVVHSLVRVAVPLAIAPLAPLGWAALALGEALGRVGAVLRLRVRHGARPPPPTDPDGAGLRAMLVRYREFVTFGTVSALIDTAAQHALVLLSAALAGPAAAGAVVLVQRIAGAVFGLLSANIADVFHGEAARLRDASPRELARQVRRRALHLAAVGVAIFVPIAVAAHFASALVFGAEWTGAGDAFALLTPTFVAAFAVSPLSRTLLVLERMRLKLLFDVASLLLPAAAYVGTHRFGGGVDAMVLAFSTASAVVYLGYYLIILRACVDFGRAAPAPAPTAGASEGGPAACRRDASK